jgi:hypothetical protein
MKQVLTPRIVRFICLPDLSNVLAEVLGNVIGKLDLLIKFLALQCPPVLCVYTHLLPESCSETQSSSKYY